MAKNWLLPRLRGFAKIAIPVPASKIMDSYRPLENEQETIIEHALDLKDFISRAKATDEKLNNNEENDDDIFQVYLRDQVMVTLRAVIKHLLIDLPSNKRLQSKKKKEIIAKIVEKIEGSPEEQIHKFRVICHLYQPRINTVEKVDDKHKSKARSYDQILRAAPSMEESNSLMTNIDWPENKKFPF